MAKNKCVTCHKECRGGEIAGEPILYVSFDRKRRCMDCDTAFQQGVMWQRTGRSITYKNGKWAENHEMEVAK